MVCDTSLHEKMVAFQIVILLICTLFLQIFGYELVTLSTISVCWSLSCVDSVVSHAFQAKEIIVASVSSNLNDDGYHSLYLGWLMHLFSKSPYEMHFLIYDISEQSESFVNNYVFFLSRLIPERSIVLIFEQGTSSFGMKNLITLQSKNEGFLRGVTLFHLNHEQPWQLRDTTSPDFIYSTMEELQEGYKQQKMVFRNYYYDRLNDVSIYTPVGPSMYGNILANMSSPINLWIPASKRKYLCQFKGRRNYVYSLAHEHAYEREQLFGLAERGETGGCEINLINFASENTLEYQSDTNYENYIHNLSNTAYVPCPSGNNPETFRLYEALEVGAIPLFIQPVWDKNFLRFGRWKHYPGPIFTTWEDLAPFLSSVTPETSDLLQDNIRRWYSEFKDDMQHILAKSVETIFADAIASDGRTPLQAAHERYKSPINEPDVFSILTTSESFHNFLRNQTGTKIIPP